MNKLLLCLLSLAAVFTASSQKVYFVYLQSEQEQPFFVKMDEKIYSSTASGYLILSKLRDSSYTFSVGFPQNKWPEQKFSVAVRSKDHGYLLKHFGEKGWGLFDLQTLGVQMASTENKEIGFKTEKTEVSAFTDILAKAADDSTLREKPVIIIAEEKKPEEKKPEEKIPETVKTETPKIEEIKKVDIVKEEPKEPAKDEPKTDIAIKPEEKKEEPKAELKEQAAVKTEEIKPAPASEYKNSKVTKRSESTTADGVTVSFTDEHSNGADTITILIPNLPAIATQPKEEPREEKKFLDIPVEGTVVKKDSVVSQQPTVVSQPVDSLKSAVSQQPAVVSQPVVDTLKSTVSNQQPSEIKPVEATKPVVKNSCKEVAAETDFMKLRKKMAAETDDDDMVDEARKYFKTKCFTTAQMRNLSVLFLDDLGKYKFFDMAYLFVSDSENFSTLQSELKNEYYINRFKVMLK